MKIRSLLALSVTLMCFVGTIFAQTAKDAQKKAVEKYPDLGRPGTAFHTRFVSLYEDAQKNTPALLSDPNWPIALADRAFDLLHTPEPAAKITPAKVDVLAKAKKGRAFFIRHEEVTIGGKLIKSVEIGDKTAVISYSNKTGKDQQPKYRFRLINAYGMEVGEFRDEWTFKTIPAGGVRSENADFYISEWLRGLLEFSTIELPDDWQKAVYLVIDGDEP